MKLPHVKKTLALLTVLIMLASVSAFTSPLANGAVKKPDRQMMAAIALNKLGLMQGISQDQNGNVLDYGLELVPTRIQGLVMFLRFIGEEYDALNSTYECPFEDVQGSYYPPMVAYAYEMGYTKGISEDLFGTDDAMTAAQYLTFILRAMGYKEGIDFEWDSAWRLSDRLGFTTGLFDAHYNQILRGDMALISLMALSANVAGSDTKLLAKLIERGIVPYNAFSIVSNAFNATDYADEIIDNAGDDADDTTDATEDDSDDTDDIAETTEDDSDDVGDPAVNGTDAYDPNLPSSATLTVSPPSSVDSRIYTARIYDPEVEYDTRFSLIPIEGERNGWGVACKNTTKQYECTNTGSGCVIATARNAGALALRYDIALSNFPRSTMVYVKVSLTGTELDGSDFVGEGYDDPDNHAWLLVCDGVHTMEVIFSGFIHKPAVPVYERLSDDTLTFFATWPGHYEVTLTLMDASTDTAIPGASDTIYITVTQ